MALARHVGISTGGSALVSDLVFRALSLSLILIFVFRSLNILRTSFVNGMPSSFGHSHRRHQVFSSICSSVTVTGSHQSPGGWTDSGCTEGFVGMSLGLVVGVGKS